jgi:heme/copper-type cytochrome/quinol oxidase subunit 2
MADLNVQPPTAEAAEEEYDNWEIVLWLVGIVSIPLVPILMVVFFTPWSGL